MTEQPKPSLTPHRDQVDRMFAELEAVVKPSNWQDAMSLRATKDIHYLFADARDAGRSMPELFGFAPFLLRAIASNIAGAFGQDDEAIPALMALACSPAARSGKTVTAAEKQVPPADGGRA